MKFCLTRGRLQDSSQQDGHQRLLLSQIYRVSGRTDDDLERLVVSVPFVASSCLFRPSMDAPPTHQTAEQDPEGYTPNHWTGQEVG